MAFETEVDDILRELVRAPGALSAAVCRAGEDAEGPAHRASLGGDTELVVALAPAAPPELPATVERAARELRACIMRYGVTEVPDVRVSGRVPRTRDALLRKATDLLRALAAMHGGGAAVLLRGAETVAVGGDLDPAQRDRLPFLRKRLDAEAARGRGRSSHAEVSGDDVYARSFWFDAYLVVFLLRPGWAPDFVRYRARAVARALAEVLPLLEDDPTTPANVRPLPTR